MKRKPKNGDERTTNENDAQALLNAAEERRESGLRVSLTQKNDESRASSVGLRSLGAGDLNALDESLDALSTARPGGL